MRNLRLYNTDATFKAHEQAAGGDGLYTETIIPGVSMSKDERKRYFNPHHEVVFIHTLTINYVDPYGVPVSESETKRFKYIPDVTQEVVITPKNVSGYVTTNELPVVVTIPNDSVVNIKYISEEYEQMKENPLTFEITSDGYLRWRTSSSSYNRRINYRKNGGSWNYGYSSTSTSSYLLYVNSGDVIEFMSDNANYGSGSIIYGSFSGSTCRFNVKGNIMSLIGSSGYSAVTELASASTFVGLFGQTQVVDASMLYMPATTALNSCYHAMFSGCTALTKTPLLPATTLIDTCYYNMFLGCTSLTTVPELPATTLANYCYEYMFRGCTSLTTAPELPATTLANSCYHAMFSGCTGLISANTIGTSATAMAASACSYMFAGCTSLTTAPELPATTLANSCYYCMFLGCTSLTTAQELPATTLANNCYANMFNGCTSLTTAPELPATTLAEDCYHTMFFRCTSLTTAPELPVTTLANNCYSHMFESCTNLTTAPELPATTLAIRCYYCMFQGCTNLNYIKCLATNISAYMCIDNWVSGVQTNSGTFVKAASMTSWPSGVHGIPGNWTVQDATL